MEERGKKRAKKNLCSHVTSDRKVNCTEFILHLVWTSRIMPDSFQFLIGPEFWPVKTWDDIRLSIY